jgi:hypothetical protein
MIDTSYIPSGLDSRNDLGRGLTKDKFHKPRMKGSTFPYVEPDQEIEQDENFEDENLISLKSIRKKYNQYQPSDFYADRKIDKFYVSTIKLADCFERPDEVLKEINALGDTMAPIPQKYKNKSKMGLPGASSKYPTGSRHYRSPGSKQGWFSPPPKTHVDPNDPFDENVFNLEDLAIKVKKIIGK